MNTKINAAILSVLKTFGDKYFIEGEVNKSKVIKDLDNYEPELLEKFLKNETIKSNFTIEIDGNVVVLVNKLIEVFELDEYWEKSFTKYSKKIGLTAGGKFIDENEDVVLDFPYKDTILKASMSKEDTDEDDLRPDEPFLNEVIAKEEIDVLLDKKILVNAKKYDENGVREIDRFDENDNLIIKGNNLLALHTIKERYAGKVKLIYIDPPYNTGNDSFKYNDKFNQSTWLTFMKNRLEVAKEFLTDDGVICVQINDNEAAYLKVLMDEVFGREAYLTTQYIRVRYPDKTLKQDSIFHKEIEQIFMYKKHKDATITPNLKESDYAYEKFKYYIKTKEPSSTLTLGNKKVEIYEEGNYEIIEGEGTKDGLKEIWATGTVLNGTSSGRFFRDYLDGRYKEDGYGVLYKVWGIGDDQFDYRFFTGPKKEGATKGKYYQGVPVDVLNNPDSKQTKPIEGFVDLAGAFGNNRHEGGVNFGSGKKPEILLHSLISYFSNEGDIVMDFFMGSGTTPAVAHKMKRQYIGIEQMNYIQDFAIPRLQTVINGDSTGASKQEDWQGGGSFVYVELMEKNKEFIDMIRKAKTQTELNEIFESILEKGEIDFRVDLEKRKSILHELSLEEQKKLLFKIIDKNQLYYNYSDIDDKDVRKLLTDNDYKFNKSFYGDESGEN